ncbi:MAG: hypothetical protein KGZ53_07990 [Peptococcaceae bacterium]|nr:hypothetical protein [Peptococcaceae bacterium]
MSEFATNYFLTRAIIGLAAIVLAWFISKPLGKSARSIFLVIVTVAITMTMSATYPRERGVILAVAAGLLAAIWLRGRPQRRDQEQ